MWEAKCWKRDCERGEYGRVNVNGECGWVNVGG